MTLAKTLSSVPLAKFDEKISNLICFKWPVTDVTLTLDEVRVILLLNFFPH